MSDLPKNQEVSEDLFDFPQVEGFSPEFLEAARVQTEAANSTGPEEASSFDDPGESEDLGGELDPDSFEEDLEDEFADNFSDLMGEPAESSTEEGVQAKPAEEPVVATITKAGGFDLRFIWGALALLFLTNLLWAWTWNSSEGRLRGEMDQRFQGYLTQQRNQLDGLVTALSPPENTTDLALAGRPSLGRVTTVDPSAALLEEIKRDLMLARYETARAKAWRLIARVDALPAELRASVEATARLLIAESYEIQGTDTQENKG